MEPESGELISFEERLVSGTAGTPAAPRPPHRPREVGPFTREVVESVLVNFDVVRTLPTTGTPAAPRPLGRERPAAEPPTELRLVIRTVPDDDLVRRVREALKAGGLDADVLPIDNRRAG